jgi:ribosomal protein S12 methylthiotransferase accessory factor
MSASIPVVYSDGTHRAATPEATLRLVIPLLSHVGITRVADITGLDRLGIPTWCAIRPSARTIQVANGKGLNPICAKVSAIMEGIEHWHAEFPAAPFRKASAAELRTERQAFLPASELPRWRDDVHVTDGRLIDWVRAEQLPDGEPIWLPACAVFLGEPQLLPWDTNGLASGNHLVEATLHALYEVIERHAMARLTRGGLSLLRVASRIVNLATVPQGPLAVLRDRLLPAGVSLTLIRVESVIPVCTFWAVLVDPASPFACSCVNSGHGSHLSPEVAAIRAVTEAAQARLTFIHGSREDLRGESYDFDPAHRRLRAFFENRRGDLAWNITDDHSSVNLFEDLGTVVKALRAAGYNRIFRVDMTNPRLAVPVVKVLVPGLAPLLF